MYVYIYIYIRFDYINYTILYHSNSSRGAFPLSRSDFRATLMRSLG